MKILEISVYNYRKGGSEAVYFSTMELLQEHGDEVVNFALKWPENTSSVYEQYFPESKETRRGILKPVKNIVNYFYDAEAAKKMEALIEAEKPDLAQVHLIWGQITGSILPVLKRHHIPVIFTIHEYRIVCPAYTFRNGLGEVCEQCQGKHFYKCVTNKCCKGSYGLSAMMAAEQYFRNAFLNPAKYIDGLVYVSQFAKSKLEQYMPALKDKPNMVLYNLTDGIRSEVIKDEKTDISLLGLVTPFEIFSPKEKKVLNTIDKINMTLRTYTGGYLRYENDNYCEGKNPWTIATLWMAMYYQKSGEKRKSNECIEFIIKSANEHGFIAEQVDNKTMSPAWVNGLAWAHAMFVTISTTH